MALQSLHIKKVLVVVLGLLLLISLHFLLKKYVDHQTWAILSRAEFVITMETLLTLMAVMIWKNIAPYLGSSAESYEATFNGDLSRRPLRKDKMKSSDVNISIQPDQLCSYRPRLSCAQIILLLYILVSLSSYCTNIFFIYKDPYWYGMLAYGCLGSFSQLATAIAISNLVVFIYQLYWRNTSKNNFEPLKRNLIFLSVLYAILASIYGLYNAAQPPTVRNVKIPVKDLPSNLEGLSIVQISDIHLGPTVGQSKVNMIVDIINRQNPDVVVLTGDLVDGSVARLRRAAEPLSRVSSKYGNYFVTGNHEYYTGDVDNWLSYLRSLSFTVLHNSHVQIPAQINPEEGKLCLVGTDDLQADSQNYKGHGFKLETAVEGCSDHEPVILLAHRPKAALLALESGYRIDLVLSGHTHGGQIFPLLLGAYLLNPFYLGLYQAGPPGSHVYVSEGTQYWGIPMRIGTFCEITYITLTKAEL